MLQTRRDTVTARKLMVVQPNIDAACQTYTHNITRFFPHRYRSVLSIHPFDGGIDMPAAIVEPVSDVQAQEKALRRTKKAERDANASNALIRAAGTGEPFINSINSCSPPFRVSPTRSKSQGTRQSRLVEEFSFHDKDFSLIFPVWAGEMGRKVAAAAVAVAQSPVASQKQSKQYSICI